MRALQGSVASTGGSTLVQGAFVLWTVYSFTQQFRQARLNAVTTLFQPLWLYRLAKHDGTAKTDAVLFLGLFILANGFPNFQDVISQVVPPWVLEERLVELQIFGMVLVMVLLAGLVAYRGNSSKTRTEESINHFVIPFFLVSLATSLWLNDIRSIQDVLRLVFPPWIIDDRPMELQVFSLTALLAALAGTIVWRGEYDPNLKIADKTRLEEEYILPPLLLPGKTTHTRLFPEKHSFDYSYLSVGVPVGWMGCAGSALSSSVNHLPSSKRRRGWFDIDAKDYLSRDEHNCLEHKLGHYLQEQGVSEEDWSFAYLVTAPKFLGYSFNPVSFWYIYNKNSGLSMMILEVNNTFGERRLYLLKVQGSTNGGGIPTIAKEDSPANALKFSNAWTKDFHVSPFSDREGTYSLTATDPLASFRKENAELIDNLIVLKSPDGKTKLVARVFSDGVKNPATISNLELSIFLARWFWVGFVTVPRIIRQAWTLYFKKKLDVFFRPEILPTGMGRAHTADEATIEAFFRCYIQDLVHCSSRPLRLCYIPPTGMSAPHTFVSAGLATTDEAGSPDATLRILSPGFYSRFVHYSHTREALDREGLATHEKNRTLLATNPEVLHTLLEATNSSNDGKEDGAVNTGPLEAWRWNMLYRVRCPPSTAAYPTSPLSIPGMAVEDIRTLPPSGFDRFVRRNCEDAGVYRATVTKMFLAVKYAGGFSGVLKFLDLVIRFILIGAVVTGWRSWGVVNSVNLWSLAKGV